MHRGEAFYYLHCCIVLYSNLLIKKKNMPICLKSFSCVSPWSLSANQKQKSQSCSMILTFQAKSIDIGTGTDISISDTSPLFTWYQINTDISPPLDGVPVGLQLVCVDTFPSLQDHLGPLFSRSTDNGPGVCHPPVSPRVSPRVSPSATGLF